VSAVALFGDANVTLFAALPGATGEDWVAYEAGDVVPGLVFHPSLLPAVVRDDDAVIVSERALSIVK
jgi:hypothetical protein